MKDEKLAGIRFDIDTIADIDYGMPKLLDALKIYDVKATFFINVGRSISLMDNLIDLNGSIKNVRGAGRADPKKISAIKKLRIKGFLKTLLLNPLIGKRGKCIFMRCRDEGHELALHGGLNHASWVRGMAGWDARRIENEILRAREEFKKFSKVF